MFRLRAVLAALPQLSPSYTSCTGIRAAQDDTEVSTTRNDVRQYEETSTNLLSKGKKKKTNYGSIIDEGSSSC
ncbi:hypothetical protein Aduo_004807 [Ancylostoma duodenale]